MPNVISARSGPGRKSLHADLSVEPPDPKAQGPGPLVILIHGYQNSQEKASRSYQDFRWAMEHAVTPGSQRRIGTYWEFHWPGDHPIPFISVASYPVRVGVAREAGDRLARHFLATEHTKGREVRIVAHSLGCRVALEALRIVRGMGAGYAGGRIEAVFLLAAAVPVRRCEPTDTWYPRPWQRCAEYVLYSRDDRVLRGAFHPGEYIADGEWGPAVGRDGLPDPRWTSRANSGLDHGEYWSSPWVAEHVAFQLKLRNLRPLEVRPLPRSPLGRAARWLESRVVPRRTLGQRAIA